MSDTGLPGISVAASLSELALAVSCTSPTGDVTRASLIRTPLVDGIAEDLEQTTDPKIGVEKVFIAGSWLTGMTPYLHGDGK